MNTRGRETETLSDFSLLAEVVLLRARFKLAAVQVADITHFSEKLKRSKNNPNFPSRITFQRRILARSLLAIPDGASRMRRPCYLRAYIRRDLTVPTTTLPLSGPDRKD